MDGWRYTGHNCWCWWSPLGDYRLEVELLTTGWQWYGCHYRDCEAAGGPAASRAEAAAEAQAWVQEHREYHIEVMTA